MKNNTDPLEIFVRNVLEAPATDLLELIDIVKKKDFKGPQSQTIKRMMIGMLESLKDPTNCEEEYPDPEWPVQPEKMY